MALNAEALIKRLEGTGAWLPAILAGLGPDDTKWKPPTGAWSILEILNHLVDEEVDDFRARLRSTLEDPSRAWRPIDPEGWARERRYNERELGESVGRFVAARRESVAWLRSLLASTDWRVAHEHPKFGPIRAGDLLGAWAAHDALHLRQTAKRLFELAGRDAEGFSTRYAGEWGV
jgi:hypothetical protein